MKPTFTAQDLGQAVRDTETQAGALRAEVAKMQAWAQEIEQLEANGASLAGEVARLQGELTAIFAQLPDELLKGYGGLLVRAAESEIARLDAAAGASGAGGPKKSGATK